MYLQKFKIWPKIERVRPYNFAASGRFLTKLFQTTCCEGEVIMWVPFLEGQPPKIWEGQKTSKFRRDFSELSTLIANISGTDLFIEHLKKLFNRNPCHVGGKKFDELWSTNNKVLEVHSDPHGPQVDILRETTFPPVGAAAPSNFYTLYTLTKPC